MFDDLYKFSLDNSERIEMQQQKRLELKLIDKQRRNRSHVLFSFNIVTKEIKIAEFFGCCDTIHFVTKEPLEMPKLLVEKDCIYRQALNKKNFIKILKREGFDL